MQISMERILLKNTKRILSFSCKEFDCTSLDLDKVSRYHNWFTLHISKHTNDNIKILKQWRTYQIFFSYQNPEKYILYSDTYFWKQFYHIRDFLQSNMQPLILDITQKRLFHYGFVLFTWDICLALTWTFSR